MPAAQRMGDRNDGDGVITTIPQGTVFINGRLASVDGSKGTDHPPSGIHAENVWETANGNTTVTAEGIPMNADGDQDTCVHVRVDGSGNVNIG